jgi:hypothetical protein
MVFKSRINWVEEIPVIKHLGSMGWGLTALSKKYGVSKQRMKQVTAKHIPDWVTNYGQVVNRKEAAEAHFAKWGLRTNTSLYDAQRIKFRAKKANALRTGYTWDLSFGELVWPEFCPILGMEIDYFAESRQENSASFDRIDNSLGYISGNVQIVSWRANRIKSDGTAAELHKIADYLDALSKR